MIIGNDFVIAVLHGRLISSNEGKNKIAGEVKAAFIELNGISDAKSYLKMYDNH